MFRPPDVQKLRKNKDVRGLLKLLTYKRSAEIRAQAAQVIATQMWVKSDLDGVDFIGPLMTSVEDPDPRVRMFALRSLRILAPVPPMEAFVFGLKDDDLKVRGESADALGRLTTSRENGQVIQALLIALEDQEAHVRWRAAQALGKIGDTSVVEAIMIRLEDPSPDVRSNAAQALGTLGDRRAIEPLLPLLHDGKRWMRTWAKTALIQLGKEDQTINCDLCNAPITLRDMSVYEVEEFRAMVANGLEPPEEALKQALLMGISQNSAIDQWRDMVFQENTAWSLCPVCEEKAQPYHQVLDPNRDVYRMV